MNEEGLQLMDSHGVLFKAVTQIEVNIMKTDIARTDTEKLVWTCPNCSVGLPRNKGVNMLNANGELDLHDGPPPAVTVKFHCPECGYHYDFKMPLDQQRRAETGGGLEG